MNRTLRLRSLVALPLVALAACAAPGAAEHTGASEDSITNGTKVANGDLDGTIQLSFSNGDPTEGSFCTGQKIGPSLILTAAHCVTNGGNYRKATGLDDAVKPGSSIAFSNKKVIDIIDLAALPGAVALMDKMNALGEQSMEIEASIASLEEQLASMVPSSPEAQATQLELEAAGEEQARVGEELDLLVPQLEALNPQIGAAMKANIDRQYERITVDAVHVFPAYLEAGGNYVTDQGPADVAIIKVKTEGTKGFAAFSALPAATIDTRPVAAEDAVTLAGYGVDDNAPQFGMPGVTKDAMQLNKGDTKVLPMSDPDLKTGLATMECVDTKGQFAANVARSYFFTPVGEGIVSIGAGDSGGPVFRKAADGKAYVVGVNSGTYDDAKVVCSAAGIPDEEQPFPVGGNMPTPLASSAARLDGPVAAWLNSLGVSVASPAAPSVLAPSTPTKVPVKPSRPTCKGWGGRCVQHEGQLTYVYCANGEVASYFADASCKP